MGEGSRAVIERYARALNDGDLDAQDALLHDDYVEDYPQSGERIRGRANHRAMLENYPGGLARANPDRIVGSEDRWVMTPAYSLLRVAGTGDEFTMTGQVTYPNGERWHFVGLAHVRDGRIDRVTSYYAPPFEAPEWRAPFVERVPSSD